MCAGRGQPNPGLTPGNTDEQPPGFAGEATKNTSHPGGYNYLVSVPQGAGTATLWVFNPSFIPSGTGGTFDHFNVGPSGDTTFFKGPAGQGIKDFTGAFDAPPFYYNVTYSLYQVTSLYDRYIGLVEAGVGSGSVSYPSLASTYISTIDGDTVVQAHFLSPGYTAFNGIWLTAVVTLPSSYTGNCQAGSGGTGWWQMIYASANGTPGDQVGVKFSLTGSPIHLLS
jgi:hypothetical protein